MSFIVILSLLMKIMKHRASLKMKLVMLWSRSEQAACSGALECGYRDREQLLCLCCPGDQPRQGEPLLFPGRFGEAGGSSRAGKGTSLCRGTAISPLPPPLEKADKASKS